MLDAAGAPVIAALGAACRALDCERAARAVDRLIGWGEGLTPAGDDFLVGLAAGLDALVRGDERRRRFQSALAEAVASRSERTTPIAAHCLRLAAGGHYPEPLLDLRNALLCASDDGAVDGDAAARARRRRHLRRRHRERLAGRAARLVARNFQRCRRMSTTTRFKIFANLYKDSVTLMQMGARLRERDGVAQASCLMATPANLAQLQDADLSIDTQVSPSDLLVVVRGDADACEAAIDAAEAMLQSKGGAGDGDAAAFAPPLTSIALGVEADPDADLVLISVPGDYAAAEAMKALALGKHVMLFSDNVSIAEERAIKTAARAKDLLVMGPDCGTAIINGVPLGFANVVRRGDIGLVAASGTGLQEVTCRIHNLGGGVSQAIGTGGRDLKEEIGGLTMLQGLAALADDPRHARDRPDLQAACASHRAPDRGRGRRSRQAGRHPLPGCRARAHAPRRVRAPARCATRPTSPSRSPAARPGEHRRQRRAAPRPPSSHSTRQRWQRRKRRCAGCSPAARSATRRSWRFIARGLACSSNAPAKGAAAFDGGASTGMSSSTSATTTTRAGVRTR